MPKVKGEFICMISQSKHVEQTQTVGLIFHFAPFFIRTKRHNQQKRNLQLVNVLPLGTIVSCHRYLQHKITCLGSSFEIVSFPDRGWFVFLGVYVLVQFYPIEVQFFSFVLNTLSYIREGTVHYLWLRGGGGVHFKNHWKWGVHFSNAAEFYGGPPF